MRRALVVEDEGPIRKLLATLLRREGIFADTASNGREALDMIPQHNYACIVLDLMMPVMGGRGVIDAMSNREIPRIPIIVVTAAGENATLDLDAQIVKLIIRKPFDVTRVVEAVRAFCAEEDDPDLTYDWPADSARPPM